MSQFAKLFQSEKYGQLLVVKQGNDDNAPEIRVFSNPEGYGVCSTAIVYEDSDQGWARQEAFFEELGLEAAEGAAKCLFDVILPEMGERDQPGAAGREAAC